MSEQTFSVPSGAAGQRLDKYLSTQIPGTSRARIQRLISEQKVLVDQVPAKASLCLNGGETIEITGAMELPPLRAIPEAILRLAVIAPVILQTFWIPNDKLHGLIHAFSPTALVK